MDDEEYDEEFFEYIMRDHVNPMPLEGYAQLWPPLTANKDEEYDEEHHLDDDVMFLSLPILDMDAICNKPSITVSGYDYMFLHQNRLKW